uniref:SH3 domain-containing protein n=1 Tax=Syphacia muris TaxID=451379 RepID=A0A0N5AHA2_9BILA
MREDSSPRLANNIPRASTPTLSSELRSASRLDYECLPRRSRSVGRYANDSSPTRDEDIVNHWREERARLSSQDHNYASVSSTSSTDARYGTCCNKLPTSGYNNNRFALERSKTVHFHLPSYRFRDEDSRPIPSWTTNCMRCGRPKRELSWREIEYLYDTLGKSGVHMETIIEDLVQKASASGINERLESTTEQIGKFIDELNILDEQYSMYFNCCVNNQRHIVDIKRMTKEEVMNKKRVEKLSEELQEQKNRRHGYVPSASPSLQKNFDRLNGLLNNFGREKRCTTPKRCVTPAVTTCTAIYSFKAQNPRELSFNRGDVIRIHKFVDANWIQGERNGQTGIFPSSYVQIDEYLPYDQKRVIVLYPFYARNRNELTLKKGEIVRYRRSIDSNWIEGVNVKGEIGIFPRTYVQDYDMDDNITVSSAGQIPDRPKTPKLTMPTLRDESQTPLTKLLHQSDMDGWQKGHINSGFSSLANIIPKNSETYRAVYAYTPKNSDELELFENDIIFVVEKCDDGWFIGTSLRTGQFGTFPGNYVERH